ncbi:hypothetical protein [Candidatus Enterococcus clewellii]|uniref:Uncharacterized protein n=1 Tax=Candidatus Enterococcus clewellii TaxID=1834193 RepID=A0A242KD85_9ENTE|nr:hypothetical protein [Enterococcus sp. 9E7_DIV0242]OTP19131.1 hypothetical protein A5888_000945 [Enterococcus sp. 9E7_DIV0242]
MGECKECYSKNNRITPLSGVRDCLENHDQYICGSCGRCICIQKDEKRGVQRWYFPFRSLEIAILYLRTADVSEKRACGIYCLTDKNGRESFKIFPTRDALNSYLHKNKNKECFDNVPIYQVTPYQTFTDTEIRRLTAEEVNQYLTEIS